MHGWMIDGHMDKWMMNGLMMVGPLDWQIYRMYRKIDERIDEWMDECWWMNGWNDAWWLDECTCRTDRWMNGWMSLLCFSSACRKETCGRQLTALCAPALKEWSSVGPNSVYQSPAAPRWVTGSPTNHQPVFHLRGLHKIIAAVWPTTLTVTSSLSVFVSLWHFADHD